MANEDQKPVLVSVIMPVRNEERAIEHSIASVLGQDYPHVEVVVADGMSDDKTPKLVAAIAERDSRVILVENRAKIMAAGFNTGLAHARGEIIMMLGGHAEIAPDYLGHCVRLLSTGKADCVSGPIETISETERAGAIGLAMSSPFGVGDVAFRIGAKETKYVDTVAFGTYTREAIERAGRLDEELVRCQDCEYNHRLRKLGGRILLAPELRSQYRSRTTLRALWRQYFQYGYWKVRVLQKHARQMRPRQFVPALFVFTLITTFSLALFTSPGRWLFAMFAGMYTLANLAISVRIAWQKKCSSFFLLPLSFAILHVSYGLGFLLGLVKFWNRWGEPDKWVGYAAPRVTSAEHLGP